MSFKKFILYFFVYIIKILILCYKNSCYFYVLYSLLSLSKYYNQISQINNNLNQLFVIPSSTDLFIFNKV